MIIDIWDSFNTQPQGHQLTLPEQEIHFAMQLETSKRMQSKTVTNGISGF